MPGKQPSNTRRDFLGLVASAAASSVLRGQNKEDGTSVPGGAHARQKLVWEFRNAYLMAVSPDGTKVCLYFTKHPQMIFAFPRGGRATYDGGALQDETLRVIEAGSWRVLYSSQLRAKPMSASFFGGGEALYAETLVISDSAFHDRQRVVIDLLARKLAEVVSPYRVHESSVHLLALSQPVLLGVEYIREMGPNAVILAALPEYREIARAPFAVTPERASQSKL
jgi:hypothetical protein